MNIIHLIIKLFFVTMVLGMSTLICLVPAGPVMMLCEKKQKIAKTNRESETKWVVTFCILGFAAIFGGMGIAIAILRQGWVADMLNSILAWTTNIT